MTKTYNFESGSIKRVDLEDYPESDYMVGRVLFLGTRGNSHGLNISNDVFKKSANSVLGAWVTSDMSAVLDSGTHTDEQKIVGIVPREQDVEFSETEDGYIDGYADVVISKRYAKDFVRIFEDGTEDRAVSVEMTVDTGDSDNGDVAAFDIKTITVLGKTIKPSYKSADLHIVRFSEEDAEKFYNQLHVNNELDGKEKDDELEDKIEKLSEDEETVEVEEKEEELSEPESHEDEPIDYEAKCAELMADIESRDNIIMEKDGEISKLSAENAELKQFKEAVELERKTASVNALLAEVKGCFDEEKLAEFQSSGMACADIDAWSNSVKAFAYEASKSKKTKENGDGMMSFAAPIETISKKKTGSIWERI